MVVGLSQVPTFDVAGFPIAALSPIDAARLVIASTNGRDCRRFHLCNAYTIALAQNDARLAHALLSADVNFADGAPVAWLGRGSGARGPVRGPSLMYQVCDEGRSIGLRHYFYGGRPGVAQAMAANLTIKLPGLHVVGVETPPFGPLNEAVPHELAVRSSNAGADVIWIGLGTPKQDYLVPMLAPLTRAALVPVGAAFDFHSGAISEAPAALQGSGLEWLYRWSREPRRLWRRYLLGNPRFVAAVLKHRYRSST